MVGPSYRCGELGHLVANCPKPKQQYPLKQSLVKGADNSVVIISKECVDMVNRVNNEKGEWIGLSTEGVDNVMEMEQGRVTYPHGQTHFFMQGLLINWHLMCQKMLTDELYCASFGIQ